MLFLFPTFFFVGFFHNQIITCRKHSRTNLSGSQLLFLIRNGQCIGSKINGSLNDFLLLIFSRKSRISGNISSADSTSLHIVSTGHPPVRSRFQIKSTSCAKSTFTSDFRNSSKALVLIISVYNSFIPPRIIRAAAPLPTTLSAIKAPLRTSGS